MVGAIIFPLWLRVIFVIATAWELAWKGFGLWRASKNNQLTWFVCMLVLNTVGILPIIYLGFFDKKKKR